LTRLDLRAPTDKMERTRSHEMSARGGVLRAVESVGTMAETIPGWVGLFCSDLSIRTGAGGEQGVVAGRRSAALTRGGAGLRSGIAIQVY
jgi:hypothetical protein